MACIAVSAGQLHSRHGWQVISRAGSGSGRWQQGCALGTHWSPHATRCCLTPPPVSGVRSCSGLHYARIMRASTKLQASSLRSVLASPVAFFSTHHPGVVFDRLSSDSQVTRPGGCTQTPLSLRMP